MDQKLGNGAGMEDNMRKNRKKIIAVSLSSLLAAGLITSNVDYASHMFTLTGNVAQAAAGEINKNTKETLTTKASAGLDSEDKVSKQETVYVNLDAAGKTKDIVVSDWLKNSGINGKLQDVSNLKDIENVKGEETFTQDGEKLTWDTADKDIYYQGSTDEKLPVGMEMTYKLDGKEMSPKDIVGKSGKLEINIKYTNSAKKTVTIGGKETEIYTPFVMVTGMILPVENFENITIDNGTIVSEGDNDIVVGYGMPGLAESLDLDNLDFGEDMDIDSSKISDKITDTVKITANVTDFEMNSTYTVATNSLFNELDFDEIEDIDELNDKMDELKDSSLKLVDGSSDLKDGTQELKDSFKKYAKAVDKLGDGAGDLKKGSSSLKNGVVDYTKGTDKLLDGVVSYVKGAKQLSKGVQSYTAGVDTFVSSTNTLLSQDNLNSMTTGTANLKNGIGQLDAGLTQAQSGVAEINAAVSKLKKTDELDACEAGLNAMITQFSAAAKQYEAAGDAESAKQYQNMVAALSGAVAYIQGGEQVAAGVDIATNGKADGEADKNGASDLAVALATMEKATDKESKETNLYTGAAALESAAGTMSTYASQLREKSGDLTDASTSLNSGAKSLIKNSSTITKNAKKLTDNSKELRDGAKDLSKGVGTLFRGVAKLVTATGDVADGISDLNDGAKELKEGMEKFNREGIRKLTDSIAEMLNTTDEFNDRISKISSASNDYTSFSGSADNMEGSVKFIMATEEISTEE